MTKTPHVLIVEDDEWLAEQYIRMFERSGIRAEHVPHALAAIDTLDHTQPDALVLDVLLPGTNAFTLLHELKSHGDLAAIPVVLCTNSADRFTQEEVEAYGVRQVLDKATMEPADLVAAVKKVLP